MKRGEVRWYQFPKPDRRRPVLILTRDSAIEHLGEVTVAPITTTIREIPSEVVLSTTQGVPRECAINLDHVQTVSRGRIGSHITSLDRATMRRVRHALLFALGFNAGDE